MFQTKIRDLPNNDDNWNFWKSFTWAIYEDTFLVYQKFGSGITFTNILMALNNFWQSEDLTYVKIFQYLWVFTILMLRIFFPEY